MRCKSIFCTFIILLSLFCITLSANEFKDYFDKAQESRDLEERIKYYTLAIDSWDPSIDLDDITLAYINRGSAYFRKNEFNLAFEDWNKAIELSPNDPMAYCSRSSYYIALEKYDNALRDSEKAIQLDPENGVAYFYRGTSLAGKHKYTDAIKDFDKSIQLFPEFQLSYIMRARAYMATCKYNEAIQDYNKMIGSQDPLQLASNEVHFFLRGDAYLAKGEYKLAYWDYNRAIKLNPDIYLYYNKRGIANIFNNEYSSALEDFKKAVELSPENVYLHLWKVITASKISEKKFKKHMKKLKKIDTSEKDDFYNIIIDYYNGKISSDMVFTKVRQAEDSYKEKVRLLVTYFYLGEFELIIGNIKKAKEYLRECINLNLCDIDEHIFAKWELAYLK